MLNHDGMDAKLQALSDSSRRRMVEILARGPASATELGRPFDMTLSAVVQHLAVLERCGIARSEKVGRVRTYSLATGPLREIETWLHTQRTAWEVRLERLDEALMNTPAKHATFSVEHFYPLPPQRVFAAWADPAVKARWFAGPTASHHMDFRVGGEEVTQGRLDDGTRPTFRSTYQEIREGDRIVYCSTLSARDAVATVSTTTVEFLPEGDGTRQVLTEYGVFLDDFEEPAWRESGTQDWLHKLTAELAEDDG